MLDQLAFQYQAVSGAVDISTTPVVEYTYSSPANGSRITSMVYPKCPDFSEADAKAIADDVLKPDDPDIRNLLNDVLNSVTEPSPYYQQMANTFENAGGNLIATAKPESVPAENIFQNIATNASNNAPRDETLAQQAESLLQEAENIIEADATALEQGIEEAP
jgi:hypothetical protein